jgi:hypothetical protein
VRAVIKYTLWNNVPITLGSIVNFKLTLVPFMSSATDQSDLVSLTLKTFVVAFACIDFGVGASVFTVACR